MFSLGLRAFAKPWFIRLIAIAPTGAYEHARAALAHGAILVLPAGARLRRRFAHALYARRVDKIAAVHIGHAADGGGFGIADVLIGGRIAGTRAGVGNNRAEIGRAHRAHDGGALSDAEVGIADQFAGVCALHAGGKRTGTCANGTLGRVDAAFGALPSAVRALRRHKSVGATACCAIGARSLT